MEWRLILALALAIPVILFPVAFVWYLNVGGMYAAFREWRKRRVPREHEEAKARALAAVGSQVKTGVLAVGRRMQKAAPIVVPTGIYALLIWFFFAGFGWEVALAMGLTMPFLFAPVAFVWYLVGGGTYAAIRQAIGKRRAVRQLMDSAIEIVRRRDALRQLINEALGAAEEEPPGIEEAPARYEGDKATPPTRALPILPPPWALPTHAPCMGDEKGPHLVIVGGSAAGIQAAITAGRLHCPGKITVIRREQKVMVPCGIPYIFGTLGSVEKNVMPDTLLGDAELVTAEVTSIDRICQTVTTAEGRTISYDKLILATGSEPLVPPIPGRDLGNVFTVKKDMEYLETLDQALEKAKDVVIIGGGFIGVEFADECSKRGPNVTVVELLPHCLFSNCDEELCSRVEEELTKDNVRLMCQSGVKSILGDGKVSEVELSRGERLKADLVIMAIGVVPNTELAQEAGLEIGITKGIKVDRYMRTSDPNIFAIGDCAEKYSFFTGRPVPLRLASIAAHEARITVANLREPRLENTGAIGVFSTKVGSVAVGVAGLTQKAAAEAGFDVVVGKADAPDRHPGTMPDAQRVKVKLLFERASGRLLGGQACCGASVGELVNALAILVQNRATPDDIRSSQIGTHPALTASPIAYQITNAAEQALVASYEAMIEELHKEAELVGVKVQRKEG